MILNVPISFVVATCKPLQGQASYSPILIILILFPTSSGNFNRLNFFSAFFPDVGIGLLAMRVYSY